ncbi:MAG TPA: acetyl-CoA carboxylase biotin carboxyl carrier protein subunit, partial [Firmicutes bacterium]|nr:acetyl-CoA carboxylase biotin carboxyl carrier protein subunit [Bacillota bacterium]
MRKFKVTVEGQTYDVLVEEVSGKQTPATPVVSGGSAPKPAAAEKAPVKSSPVNPQPRAQTVEKATPAGGTSVP